MPHQAFVFLRKIRLVGLVARVVEMRSAHRTLVGRTEEKGTLGRLGVDGKIILKFMLKIQYKMAWTKCIWFRMETGGGVL